MSVLEIKIAFVLGGESHNQGEPLFNNKKEFVKYHSLHPPTKFLSF